MFFILLNIIVIFIRPQNYSFYFSFTSILTIFCDKRCYFADFDMWTLQKSSVIEVEEVGIALTCGIQTEYCTSETSHHFG